VTVSEQLHIGGAHKTMMIIMMMIMIIIIITTTTITIIIILLKVNTEEFSKIGNMKINCMVQYRCYV
jgi:hypothetical protein